MSEDIRDKAPTADEIEAKFQTFELLAMRPVIWAAIATLQFVRGFGWSGSFEHDLDQVDGPLIFAANHSSHTDTAAILDTLPPRICRRTVVAAALDVFGPDRDATSGLRRRIFKDILQFTVAAGFHAFAFDRKGPPLRSVRTSVQLIRNGWHLLLFPEGTRSKTGKMSEFKPGVALLAKFTGQPVIPVHVEGGDAILPSGVFMPQPAHAYVRYGAPLYYQPDDTPATFTARVQQAVQSLGMRQPMAVRPSVTARYLRRRVLTRPQPVGVQQSY